MADSDSYNSETNNLRKLHLRVLQLEMSMEDIMKAGPASTGTPPTIRVRIAHDQVKEGHRVKETTIEFTTGSNGTVDWQAIEGELRSAFIAGSKEAELRNSGVGE